VPDELTAAPAGVDPDVHWAVEDVRHRAEPYGLYRAYYLGHHRLTFATAKFRNAFGDLFREFADNVCDDVVDEPVDRMQIVGWSGKTDAVSKAAQDMHDRNRLDARLGNVHRNGFREGDGFVIIWKDPDEVTRWYPQDPDLMAVQYDADRPDLIVKAAKVWKSGKVWRVTIYYPDRIARWASKGTANGGGLPSAKAFVPYQEIVLDQETGEHTTLDHETANDSGRCPVFHYPAGEISRYGRSVLRDVIPLQDALNKSVADMLVGMEFHALPQRWATGVVLERDEQGNEIDPYKGGDNRLWTAGKDQAQFGQFPAADLAALLEVQDGFRLEIARKGALPPHSVNLRGGGAAPSGISLLVAEGKTIKRVLDAERDWGQTHCEAMAYALTMDGVPCEAADLEIEWMPPATRDEKALIETLIMKKDLKVSAKQLLLEAGYDEDQAQDFLDEAQASADEAAVAFGQGGAGRPVPPSGDVRALQTLGMPQGPQQPAEAPATALAG
jgi:hypothetical protein